MKKTKVKKTQPVKIKVKPEVKPKRALKPGAEPQKTIEAKACVRFIRVSPRKARLVINLVRGKNVVKAIDILEQLPQKSSKIVNKLIKSAVANAKQKGKIEDKDLFIYRIWANEGVRWKRIRPRSMGRADRYLKRTAHINVIIRQKLN